jgi:hypothetical protein
LDGNFKLYLENIFLEKVISNKVSLIETFTIFSFQENPGEIECRNLSLKDSQINDFQFMEA